MQHESAATKKANTEEKNLSFFKTREQEQYTENIIVTLNSI